MIRYLRHQEIDRERWDATVAAANSVVYANSWYLDVASPGWDALILDDYEAIMPLTWKRKMGIRYLFQPYFTQQLGILASTPQTHSLVKEFLVAIPTKFRYVNIQLNTANEMDDLPGWGIEQRVTHHLHLGSQHDLLQNAYNTNRRRDLRKAMDAGLTVSELWDPELIISGMKRELAARTGLKDRDWQLLINLMNTARTHRCASSFGAYAAGRLLSAETFLIWGRYVIYWAGFTTAEGRELGSSTLVFDHVVRQFAGQELTFDFEGSMIPGVARFFRSFGAKEVPYWRVVRNRLPWPLRLLKR